MLSALFFASSIKLAAAGAATPYATLLARIQHDWPAAEHGFPALSCEVTKGEPRLVGLRQSLSIDAPLGRVSEVLDAFEKYGEISPSFDDVHVVIRTNKDSVLTSWTRHIPLFFLPNLRYELRYLIDRSHPGRVDYRSTLETSDHLKAAEGLIIVEAVSPASTRLYRLDYIGPPAGVFAAAPTARLWDERALGPLLFGVRNQAARRALRLAGLSSRCGGARTPFAGRARDTQDPLHEDPAL